MTILKTVRLGYPIQSNSRPIPTLCEDFEEYFVKFPISGTDSIDLTYEFVCKHLGNHFGVPMPEIAIVSAKEGSWTPTDIPELTPNMIGFASKKVEDSDILSIETALISSKHDYNRIQNPLDLLRIGIFDLHINNMDRCEENFNLIAEYGTKDSLVAIDHVAAFGGVNGKNRFIPRRVTDVGKNILRSEFGKSVIKYTSQSDRQLVLAEYESQMRNLSPTLDVAFRNMPTDWDVSDNLHERMVTFLTNDDRNQSIIEEFNRLFRLL